MTFQNPFAFLLVLLLPLLFILRKFRIFRRISLPVVLSDWNGSGFVWKNAPQKIISVAAKIFYICAFILTVIALAEPVSVKKEKVYTSAGTDVVFVLDSSPSMAAKDIEGMTRLEAAKNAILTIMENHDGYAFSLVVVGSEASMAVPPTVNHQYFKNQLEKTELGKMGDGTALGEGLSTAVYHLISTSAPKKCIILLTDGENNAGQIHPETAAELAQKNEIALYVVGIGSKGNVPIEYTDPLTGKNYSGYLNSDYNSMTLREIANTGGGLYYEVKTLDELQKSFETVTSRQATNQSYTLREITTPLYKSFLRIAIILFVLGAFIRLVIFKGAQILKLHFNGKKRVLLRYAFLLASFLCAAVALSGISWGSYLAPVQKNSASVAMVFDISYSMMAKDCPENMTRLQASATYARQLLSHMNDTAVSVIVAKGDGMEIIPMTQDKAQIESLLDVLSPALMTSGGTSLGKGILKARQSLPENVSSAGKIWVFTDGEETDGLLTAQLEECIKQGIPVFIVGFGSENESAVLAGDGVTQVYSALRQEAVLNDIKTAEEKYRIFKNRATVQYVNYLEKGSAQKLLQQLRANGSEGQITSYEVKPIPRYKFFLVLSILFLALSFVFAELSPSVLAVFLLASIVAVNTGCSSDSAQTLKGVYNFQQKNYSMAIAAFKKTLENAEDVNNQQTLEYALYNLGTTYAALDENESAETYFSAISADAPDRLRFAAFYNAGILAHKNGDFESARENFKRALEIDSKNLHAKINMELSLQQAESSARQNQSNAVQGAQGNSDYDDMEKSIFEHIKENDQKQWKNSEQTPSQDGAQDY